MTLHAIRVNGPITRSDLAGKTGLTLGAVANITNRLLADRLILNAGHLRGGRGQPAKKFIVNPDGCFSVGLNVDRDHVTLVVLDFMGTVRARTSRELAFAKPAAVKAFFARAVRPLLASAGITINRLIGVGVAFPDDITRAHLPDQPADYADWASVRIDDLIRDVLNIPVYIENDAAAAAIGEMQFGLGHRYRNFFYVLITAALGGGVVADGSHVRGATGRSGEIGWLRDRADRGTPLQNIVSLSALYGRLGDRGFHVATPGGLTRLAAAARPIVEEWIQSCTEALIEPFIAINCLMNPEAILIGGRLPAVLVERLCASLNLRLAERAAHLPSAAGVFRALISEDAPAVGAAILPFSYQLLPTRTALLHAT